MGRFGKLVAVAAIALAAVTTAQAAGEQAKLKR